MTVNIRLDHVKGQHTVWRFGLVVTRWPQSM